ncbi:hypothetical protein [Nonomuraea sp. NPDC046570]|uniref:hypothetical protein n=1 Tax=Nonomuraea sp. NPDC046570 TaxID=3155255 RepID=UPI0033CEA38F
MSAWTMPENAAAALHRELAALGIDSDLRSGNGLATVSVWGGLLVWTNGQTFWWIKAAKIPPEYADAPANQPQEAALRVAARYTELIRERQRPSTAS